MEKIQTNRNQIKNILERDFEMKLEFRTLYADEIECRVNQISQDYLTLLLYYL